MAHSSLSSGWTVGETIIEASLVCMRLTSNDGFFLHFNNILNESCLLWRPRLDVLSPSVFHLPNEHQPVQVWKAFIWKLPLLMMIAHCWLPSIISTSTSPANAPTSLFSHRIKKKVSRNLSCYYSCWSIFYFCFHIYSPSSEPEQYIAAVALQSQKRVMKMRYNF